MNDTQTLVLDQGMKPIDIVHWSDAVTMWFTGKAEVLEEYDREVRSTYLVIKVPAVVRLIRAFRRHKKPAKFSRINVYGRDGYRCLYCGAKKSIHDLTYDHIVPRSQGGKTTWLNIATACVECNTRKAGRTPEQAGMKLRKQPTQPVDAPAVVIQVSRESAPAAWRDFLYWTGSLDED